MLLKQFNLISFKVINIQSIRKLKYNYKQEQITVDENLSLEQNFQTNKFCDPKKKVNLQIRI